MKILKNPLIRSVNIGLWIEMLLSSYTCEAKNISCESKEVSLSFTLRIST